MDTRAWGPSGWQLLHLIAHNNPEKARTFFPIIKDILPCKFCRESTALFMKEMPIRGDVRLWMYNFHNRVNKKLRDQCKDDPRVICPPPDPSFEQVKARYDSLVNVCPDAPPGMDFLFSIAYNYTPDKAKLYEDFFTRLADVYPYGPLRLILKEYIPKLKMKLGSRNEVVEWLYEPMHDMNMGMSRSVLPTLRGVYKRYGYYASSCNRGKTCRNGRRKRDHRKTYRVTHARLLR
jgi:hypothetical protein